MKKRILWCGIALFTLHGCFGPKVKNGRYDLEECKRELNEMKDFDADEAVDKIIVVKHERKMYLYKKNEVVGVFPVSLGKNPMGKKRRKGDNRTPEGSFYIDRKLCSPKYYRSLCISYPRPEDIEAAKKRGVDPGGSVTIHGQPVWNADGHGDEYTLSHDWTQGCVAVSNATMKRLWYAVKTGVPVIIRP
jgi:murein L,D-transpeptidase YafK